MHAQTDLWAERRTERRVADLGNRVRSLEAELRRMHAKEEARRSSEAFRQQLKLYEWIYYGGLIAILTIGLLSVLLISRL